MFSIKNKVIVVTGGNGLLGKQMVSSFRNQGAIVIAADIHFDNKGIDDIVIDITNENSVKNGIKSLIEKYKHIDGWVNNAYPRTKDWGNKFEDIELASWKQNVDWQMNSYFFMSQQVAIQMIKQQSGSIVNIASIYGVVAPDFSIYEGTNMTMPAAYSAIKGGLVNLTRYMASYLGPKGINVNSVSPGGIYNSQNKIFVSNYEKKVPMQRMASSEDISPTVAFLLSDKSSYITGQNIIIDGGWTAI